MSIFPRILAMAAVIGSLAVAPLNSEAAKQLPAQKQAVRGKQAPKPASSVPARRLTKDQAHRVLLLQPSSSPIDFSDRYELVNYRVHPGETLSDVLTRHKVSKAESLLMGTHHDQNCRQ